jgi:WD40 repeat protein
MHVFAVAFHPDGRRIFSAGIGGLVKVWDVLRSRPVVYRGHSLQVTGTAISRDGRLVATESDMLRVEGNAAEKSRTGTKIETMKFWDPETGEEVRTPPARGADPGFDSISRVGDLAITSPDSRRIFKVMPYDEKDDPPGDRDVRVIDAASGRVLLTLLGHTDSVHCVAISPDGRRIATASDDRTVKLWDAETGQEVLTLRDHTAGVFCVAFSPDGNRLVSGSIDRTARVWDATPLTFDIPALTRATPSRPKP